jgi:hypothetical protein
MLPGNEYVDAETRIWEIPHNANLSVAPPEGKLYLPRRILAYIIMYIVICQPLTDAGLL